MIALIPHKASHVVVFFAGLWAFAARPTSRAVGLITPEYGVRATRSRRDGHAKRRRVQRRARIVSRRASASQDSYTLAERRRVTPQGLRGRRQGQATAKWLTRRQRFVVRNSPDQVAGGRPQTQLTRQGSNGRRTRSIDSPDNPRGSFETKRVFAKKQ